MKNPKTKDNITVQNLGDEVILYDSESENVHILNHTAQAIWELCNGENTIEDILTRMYFEFPSGTKEDLLNDINTVINDFRGKKLLI